MNIKAGLTTIALASAFASSAMACDADGQNRITSKRQIVLDEIDALNATAIGQYLIDNNLGQFDEVSMSRCSNRIFSDGKYIGEVRFVLNESHPYIPKDASDAEYATLIDKFAVNLGHHVCEINDMKPATGIELKAQESAINMMTLKAFSNTMFEEGLADGVEENARAMHTKEDMSVCGVVRQAYTTLGLG